MNTYTKTDEKFLHSNKRCYKIYLKNKRKYIRKKDNDKNVMEYVLISSLKPKNKKKKGGTDNTEDDTVNKGLTTLEIYGRHANYSPLFGPQQFNTINNFYITNVDKHITLFTKLFILFIFYIRDLQDNKQDTVEDMKKSLDWIINEILTNIQSYELNFERLNKTLNIPVLSYINNDLRIHCVSETNIIDGERISKSVEKPSDVPSEMFLKIHHLYEDTKNIDHAVYASYDEKGQKLYIYDINCSDLTIEDTKVSTYFQSLLNTFDTKKKKYTEKKYGINSVVYVALKNAQAKQISKHNVVLDDLEKIRKNNKYPSTKPISGICAFMSAFYYFFLSFESQDNKLTINKTFDILAQKSAKNKDNKDKENTEEPKKTKLRILLNWTGLGNTPHREKLQDETILQNVNKIEKLLHGTPNKANFIQIVNMLRNNDYITQQTSKEKLPTLELYCLDENSIIENVQEGEYKEFNFEKEHITCTTTIKPCDGNLSEKIIMYIIRKFYVQLLDLLHSNIPDKLKNESLYINHFIIFESVFSLKRERGSDDVIVVSLKIKDSPNTYIVSRIKYKKTRKNEHGIIKNNEMKLNTYLSHHVAPFLLGKIMNTDEQFIKSQLNNKEVKDKIYLELKTYLDRMKEKKNK